MASQSPKRFSGAAGEYYVAAELSARGWMASITPRGIERTDLLAQHHASGTIVAIQAKASVQQVFSLSGPKVSDHPAAGGDEIPTERENEWFVFVGLNPVGERPDFYVVPRNVVAGGVWVTHRMFLRGDSEYYPGTNPRSGGTFRRLTRTHLIAYQEAWSLLEEPASAAPFALPPRFLEMSRIVGLPDGHPGWPDT